MPGRILRIRHRNWFPSDHPNRRQWRNEFPSRHNRSHHSPVLHGRPSHNEYIEYRHRDGPKSLDGFHPQRVDAFVEIWRSELQVYPSKNRVRNRGCRENFSDPACRPVKAQGPFPGSVWPFPHYWSLSYHRWDNGNRKVQVPVRHQFPPHRPCSSHRPECLPCNRDGGFLHQSGLQPQGWFPLLWLPQNGHSAQKQFSFQRAYPCQSSSCGK